MSKSLKKISERSMPVKSCGLHRFKEEDIQSVRTKLLSWYDKNKRDLPWRNLKTKDLNERAYGVWVSEIMLQQTQVATVIDYYNKWMKKWPTVKKLANASLDSVIEAWTGLGYYSRGRRLLEGAQKVVNDLGDSIPSDAASLMKDLPGVGRYTASAIASIAYGEVVGVVDGNVIRVLSRLRAIGADPSQQSTMDVLWSLANTLVDHERPGDFNQAMMELGATVCTPKTPSCSTCPVRDHCLAWKKVEDHKKECRERLQGVVKEDENQNIPDIEEICTLCILSKEWDQDQGVMNYPRKAKKKPLREQLNAVCLIQKLTKDSQIEYIMIQRPPTGLLANMWEFPSVEIDVEDPQEAGTEAMKEYIRGTLGLEILKSNRRKLGEVVHIFSHIRQTYRVEVQVVAEDDLKQESSEGVEFKSKWVTERDMDEMAISTAMKKVLAALYKEPKPKKRKAEKMEDKGQSKLESFFKSKTRKKDSKDKE